MDPLISNLNFVIPLLMITAGVSFFGLRRLTGWPAFLDGEKHPATVVTFTLWISWWLTIGVAYFMLKSYGMKSHTTVLFVLDVGDLCLIGSVITYLGGNRTYKEIKDRLVFPLIAVVVFMAFYLSCLMISGR